MNLLMIYTRQGRKKISWVSQYEEATQINNFLLINRWFSITMSTIYVQLTDEKDNMKKVNLLYPV